MPPSSDVTCGVAIVFAILLSACADIPVTPTATGPPSGTGSATAQSAQSWGPETPNFNLQIILRGAGFGLVAFRQPNDDLLTIHLDTWVRDLASNTSYLLQRAVDVNVDDNCTSTSWLTLGKGLQPQSITTDDRGTGGKSSFALWLLPSARSLTSTSESSTQ